MYEVAVRFKFVKESRVIECLLDNRLSFIDNFNNLKELIDEDINNFEIYDYKKSIFLNKDVPINNFEIKSFIQLYVFT